MIEKLFMIISKYFRRKDIHNETWIIPETKETNQKVRFYRGADANSEYFFVAAIIKPT